MMSTRLPRVTVAIPTLNRASYLEEAARSVLAQTFSDLELLILDNASDDDTPEVVARLADDSRVSYVQRAHNIGFVPNQREAYYGGSGEYRIVIGDDDLLEPEHLERLVEVLDGDPTVGVAHSSFFVIDAEGVSQG